MLFLAVLMNITNSKVCLKGEWSIDKFCCDLICDKLFSYALVTTCASLRIEFLLYNVGYVDCTKKIIETRQYIEEG